MSDQNEKQVTDNEELKNTLSQVEMLTKQNQEYLDGWKRAKADFVNYKNDQDKRQKEMAQFAGQIIISQMIPVLENFAKAFEHVPEEHKDSAWIKGVENIYRQMQDTLKMMGLESLENQVGQIFNPELHEAVGQENIDDQNDDMVTQQVSSGFKLHGKIIVPARVIVNKKI